METSTILAIETGGAMCQVAISQGPDIAVKRKKLQAHSKVLLTLVDDLLNEAELPLSELDAISVNHGPGSFTGVRVGCACAQGLAFANDTPIVALSSLEVLAWYGAQQIEEEEARIFVHLDARMEQLYAAWFHIIKTRDQDANRLVLVAEAEQPATALAPAECQKRWPIENFVAPLYRVGASGHYIDDLPASYRHLEQLSVEQAAEESDLQLSVPIAAMLDLAHEKYRQGNCVRAEKLEPYYVRNNVVQPP